MQLRRQRVEGEGAHAPWCLVLAFLAALVTGCTPVSWRVYTPQEVRAEVRTLAATELSCAPKSLSIRRRRSSPRVDILEVAGCDQRVVYTCTEASLTELECRPQRLPTTVDCTSEEFSPILPAWETLQEPVEGSPTRSRVQAVLRARVDEVRTCYLQGAVCRPGLTGRVTVKLIIAPDGRVSIAAVESSSMGYPAVERCIANAVEGYRFPESEGDGITVVTYPYVFFPPD